MEITRVGLIGCGGIANYHVSHLLEMPDVRIVAVADPIEARRTEMAKKTGATRMYTNHTELYDNESPDTLDCVYVCVEPTAHTDTETRAIDMGLPFLVEKPMTLNLAQGRDIARRIAEKNLITAVGFQDRYLDIVDIIKEELPKHEKGGLVYGSWLGGIPMVWWWLKKSTCGAQLVEQNIHLLDLLRYFFGEPISVYATASRGIVKDVEGYDTDDHSTAVILFKDNVTATLVSGCYLTEASPRSGMVITLKDMVIDYGLRKDVIFKTKSFEKKYLNLKEQGMILDRTFIDAVKSKDGSKIRSPYADALKSLELGLAANRSMETGEVVKL